MPEQLDRERLTEVTNGLIKAFTDPDFIERMSQARERFDDNDTAKIAELLSLDGLREAGVDLPDDFRLTSRVFEDYPSGRKLRLEDRAPKRDSTVAWGACAGGGGLTFCGCAGGGT